MEQELRTYTKNADTAKERQLNVLVSEDELVATMRSIAYIMANSQMPPEEQLFAKNLCNKISMWRQQVHNKRAFGKRPNYRRKQHDTNQPAEPTNNEQASESIQDGQDRASPLGE